MSYAHEAKNQRHVSITRDSYLEQGEQEDIACVLIEEQYEVCCNQNQSVQDIAEFFSDC